ncbi:MAG: RNA-binding protein [Oscillospiraceae bacterium]|jgi:RNA-binding protein YlmH
MNAAVSHLTDDKEERILLSRVLDKAKASETRNIVTYTPFLSPRVQEMIPALLGKYRGTYRLFGGYPGAERQMLFFLPDYETGHLDPDDPACPVCALRSKRFERSPLTHRDVLGALLGGGISREKLGDILVSDADCTLLMQKELSDFLRQNVKQAGRTALHWVPVPLSQIAPPPPATKDVEGTVSSLRLDAVCALGFSLSRVKAAGHIAAGAVFLNHRACVKPEQGIREGDVISVRGLGKCQVASVGGVSRKNRIFLLLKRHQ